MPPGITMSPGFWSGFAGAQPLRLDRGGGIARHARRAALAVRGGLHGVGGVEVAGDLGMRRDRHAADGADGIGDIAGRGLLDILLRAQLLRPPARTRWLISLSVVASVHCCIVMSGVGRAGPHGLHFPQAGLAQRQFDRAGIGRGSKRPAAQPPRRRKQTVASCCALPSACRIEDGPGSVDARAAAGPPRHTAASGRRTRRSRLRRAARRGISPPCRNAAQWSIAQLARMSACDASE